MAACPPGRDLPAWQSAICFGLSRRPPSARACVTAVALLLAGSIPSALAQTVSSTTYPFTSSASVALEDMSSGTTQLLGSNLDDNASSVTSIGFDFWFVGARYTEFSVNANGLLRLGSLAVGGNFANDLATTTNVPQVAPYWDDLWIGTNGKVHYKVVGSAPNRKLVVEWLNVQVPRVGSGSTGAATFQVWLSESTGRLEFVYGAGMATNAANGGVSVGFGSSASLFASITVTGPTVAYGVSNNTNVAAITAGTRYAFAAPTPAAPTSLSFSGVTATAMTLGWTDNAANEIGYAIYRSTDGVSYSFVTQLAANSTSFTQTGLSPTTTYYWLVHSATEGALSGALSGSQATPAPGTVATTGSGSWSSTVPDAPWPGGVVPTASDNVVIADGHTVTIDTGASCFGLTVGQGTSGALLFESANARTLVTGGDVLVSPGAVLSSALTGAQTGHSLSVGGSLTNQGTLDFSTNGNTAGAGLTFSGGANASLAGSGAITNLRTLTVNKGSGPGAVLALGPASFSVQGATGGAPAFLTLTNGTLRIAGTFSFSGPVFASASYSIGSNAGLWLDNPSFVVTAQNGSPSVTGVLRVSGGTYNVGTSTGNSLGLANGCAVTLEGGAVNTSGRFAVSSATNRVTYSQTGGTLTVATVGHTSTTFASFDLGTASSSTVAISGGTIVVQSPSAAASGPRDFRNRAGTQTITGGALQLGNASTSPAQIFYLNGTAPALGFTGASVGHAALLLGNTTVMGATVIGATDTLKLNGFRFTQSGGGLANEGTLTGAGTGSELYFQGTASPQTYSGSGVITIPLQGNGLTVDNPAGVTIDAVVPQNLVTQRVNLVRGTLYNSQKLTLGNVDTVTTTVIQIGAAGLTDPGGSFDTFPTLNLGPAGLSIVYLQEGAARTTGFEIPASRSVPSLTLNNSNGLILSGGALTVTAGLTLTSGLLTSSSANLLTLANSVSSPPAGSSQSYVQGPLGIQFTVSSPTSRTYAIGAAGAFRPLVLKSVNTASVARLFTAEVIPGPTGGAPLSPLQSLTTARYWRVSNSSNLNASARINLTFGPDDNVGTLANVRVAQ